MKQVDLKKIGRFIKTHGVHGALVLAVDDNISADLLHNTIKKEGWVFVDINGIAIPFSVHENGIKQLNDKSMLLKLANTDSDKAKELYPTEVFINNYYLQPKDLQTEDNYNSIEGFSIVNKQFHIICTVEYILDIPQNPLIAANYNNKEVLIPINSEYIIDINYQTKQIITNFPSDYLKMLQ